MTARAPLDRQSLAALSLAAIIGTAAVFAPSLEQQTLTIAIHQAVEGVAVRELARRFTASHNVSVEVFELPYDALFDAEMAAVAAPRSRYDLIMVDDPWLPALVGEDDIGDSTRLERLAFRGTECSRLAIDDFVPTTLRVSLHPDALKSLPAPPGGTSESFSCDDAKRPFYAIPFIGNSQLFVTRSAVAPREWSEVLKTSIGSNGADNGYVARVGAGNSIVTDFMPILWTFTPDEERGAVPASTDEDTAEAMFELDSQQLKNAFSFFHTLGKSQHASRGVVSVDDFDLTIRLIKQQAAMAIEWSAWVMAISKLAQSHNGQLDVGAGGNQPTHVQVSQVPGGQPALGAWLLAIPARAPHKDIARDFLLFATAPTQMVAAAERGNPPPRKSVLENPELRALYPSFGAQLESLSHARPRPRTPLWRPIEQVLGDCLSALYDDAITEEQAWQRVKAGLEPIQRRQREVDGYRKAGMKEEVRKAFDQPFAAFSCQREPASATHSD
jgi:multiple sugar transport system substrate-binding protein